MPSSKVPACLLKLLASKKTLNQYRHPPKHLWADRRCTVLPSVFDFSSWSIRSQSVRSHKKETCSRL
jgi:hypothetical protein